jgi:hypothetical protein
MNVTKIKLNNKFLFSPHADSRATPPASSKLLKTVAEAPLLRGGAAPS